MRKTKKTETEYEYQRIPITPSERQKLLILAAQKGYSSIAKLLHELMIESLEKAEKAGIFSKIDFLEEKQQEQK